MSSLKEVESGVYEIRSAAEFEVKFRPQVLDLKNRGGDNQPLRVMKQLVEKPSFSQQWMVSRHPSVPGYFTIFNVLWGCYVGLFPDPNEPGNVAKRAFRTRPCSLASDACRWIFYMTEANVFRISHPLDFNKSWDVSKTRPNEEGIILFFQNLNQGNQKWTFHSHPESKPLVNSGWMQKGHARAPPGSTPLGKLDIFRLPMGITSVWDHLRDGVRHFNVPMSRRMDDGTAFLVSQVGQPPAVPNSGFYEDTPLGAILQTIQLFLTVNKDQVVVLEIRQADQTGKGAVDFLRAFEADYNLFPRGLFFDMRGRKMSDVTLDDVRNRIVVLSDVLGAGFVGWDGVWDVKG